MPLKRKPLAGGERWDRNGMIYSSASWSIDLAPGWVATEHDDHVAILPLGEDAKLRLTTFSIENANMSAEKWVDVAAHTNRLMLRPVVPVQCGDFDGYRTEFASTGTWLRGWVLRAGRFPLDATYTCKDTHAGRDDAVVESMLDTLRLTRAG